MRNLLALLLLSLSIFVGCMKPDATNPSTEDPVQVPEDQELRAGASSSTNWPVKFGDPSISIAVAAGSDFILRFSNTSGTGSDSARVPAKLTGKLSVCKSGTIPVLDSLRTASVGFFESDSVGLAAALLDSLFESSRDTLLFNVHIKTDSLETWAFGFGYSRKSKQFFKALLSIETENSLFLKSTLDTIQGVLDTSGGLPKSALNGKSIFCFYIPGTPFFWKPTTDSLVLGPIPDGNYPLRLLRVTYAGEKDSGTEMEAYEVGCSKLAPDSFLYRIKPGAAILNYRAHTTVSLRPAGLR